MLQANYCIKKEKREKKVGNEYGYVDFTERVQFIYYTALIYIEKKRHRTEHQLRKESKFRAKLFFKNTLSFRGGGWFFKSQSWM